MSPLPFNPLEKEKYGYQAPQDCLREMKVQHQLPDAPYPSCYTSLSSLGLQNIRDPIPSDSCLNSVQISNLHAANMGHSASPSRVYPQAELNVINPIGFDSSSHHSSSPLFGKVSHHFIPVQNIKNSEISAPPASSLQTSYPKRISYCASPAASSTSEGYPKFLFSQCKQVS